MLHLIQAHFGCQHDAASLAQEEEPDPEALQAGHHERLAEEGPLQQPLPPEEPQLVGTSRTPSRYYNRCSRSSPASRRPA